PEHRAQHRGQEGRQRGERQRDPQAGDEAGEHAPTQIVGPHGVRLRWWGEGGDRVHLFGIAGADERAKEGNCQGEEEEGGGDGPDGAALDEPAQRESPGTSQSLGGGIGSRCERYRGVPSYLCHARDLYAGRAIPLSGSDQYSTRGSTTA